VARSRDDDDDDDPPRRRRRNDDDDDGDEYDRPRSRRRYEDEDDEDDDRPRRRRRYDDYDDVPRRARRRARGGPGVGKVLAIVFGSLGAVAIVVAVVMIATGSISFRSVNVSYEKYAAITQTDTIESLDKELGPPTRFDRGEWATVTIGQGGDEFGRRTSSTLADYNQHAQEVTAWYRWKKGDEEVYVAEGTDFNGRKGLVIKIYFNPKVVEDLFLRPEKARKDIPWFHLEQLGGGTVIRFGGGGR
jgi:hypothetical protein